MRKTLSILMALMVLMTTSIFALVYSEPTYTLIDTETLTTPDVGCFGYGGDVFCLMEDGATDYLLKYDVGTGTVSTEATYGQVGYTYDVSCDVYGTEAFCSGNDFDYGNTFKIDMGTYTVTPLAEYNYSDNYAGGISDCVFKDGTDEFWCFGWNDNIVLQQMPVRYYDVSDATWTTFAVANLTTTKWGYTSCDFNGDDLYCAGGYGDLGSGNVGLPYIFHIDTSTGVYEEIDISPYVNEAGNSKFVEGEFFVIGGDGNAIPPYNTSIIFHPSNNTYTLLPEMPEEIGNWYGCGEIDEYNDVCMPTYDAGWGQNTNVYLVTYGEVSCVEDWQPYYTACDVTDNMTLYYLDLNECGTFDNLPPDNDTLEVCNYCDPTWEETSLDCVAGDSERDITYEYTNTCCADTGLPTDCTIPADTTESCIGLHESSDVPNVVIDFLVEYGREMVGLAGLIAVFGLGIWAYSMYRKR